MPLTGIRVLELALDVAGQYAAKLLGDLGAEVVKVESPAGDPSRSFGPFPGNTPDPLWQHSPRIWLLDMGMQLALTAVLAGLTWWRLRQASPGRRH